VAALCGFLPIALCIAGGHLNRNRSMQVAEFVARLNGPERLKNLKLGRSDVHAVFEASYVALSPRQQSAFRMLGVMTTGFDDSAALATMGGKPGSSGTVLEELTRRNLLRYDDKARRFRWHDLLREFACNHAKAKELKQAKWRHAEHFIAIARESKRLYLKGGQDMLAGLELFDRERRHLETAFDWLETRRDKASAILLGSLVEAAVYLSDLRFGSHQRIRWSAAQAKAARLLGFRIGEGGALHNLGLAHAEAGDPKKAIELYEQALIVHRKAHHRRAEGEALGNLGNAYADLGNVRKALQLHEQNLLIARDLGDH
jgi:tetratricopeptide (TPR) repeat protein